MSNKVRTHRFNGVKYEIKIIPHTVGQCTYPRNKDATPSIDVFHDLNTKEGIRILLHECLHAEDWSKNHDLIKRASIEISSLLWRLGFRIK